MNNCRAVVHERDSGLKLVIEVKSKVPCTVVNFSTMLAVEALSYLNRAVHVDLSATDSASALVFAGSPSWSSSFVVNAHPPGHAGRERSSASVHKVAGRSGLTTIQVALAYRGMSRSQATQVPTACLQVHY